jgi:hypothetical protein
MLIKKVYNADQLLCPKCGGTTQWAEDRLSSPFFLGPERHEIRQPRATPWVRIIAIHEAL